MPIDVETMIEKAIEPALMRAFDRFFKYKAEAMFIKAFSNWSFSKRIEEKIEKGLNRFFQDGIRGGEGEAGIQKVKTRH